VRWFNRADLHDKIVFPERLKHEFWERIEVYKNSPDPFIRNF
jgi:hypothetical protein